MPDETKPYEIVSEGFRPYYENGKKVANQYERIVRDRETKTLYRFVAPPNLPLTTEYVDDNFKTRRNNPEKYAFLLHDPSGPHNPISDESKKMKFVGYDRANKTDLYDDVYNDDSELAFRPRGKTDSVDYNGVIPTDLASARSRVEKSGLSGKSGPSLSSRPSSSPAVTEQESSPSSGQGDAFTEHLLSRAEAQRQAKARAAALPRFALDSNFNPILIPTEPITPRINPAVPQLGLTPTEKTPPSFPFSITHPTYDNSSETTKFFRTSNDELVPKPPVDPGAGFTGSAAAFLRQNGGTLETAESLRKSDPMRKRIDWLAGSGINKRRRNFETAAGTVVENGIPTIAALAAAGLTDGIAAPLVGETALGRVLLGGANMLVGNTAAQGTKAAQDFVSDMVDPQGTEEFRRRQAELQQQDPMGFALLENLPQMMISGPSLNPNLSGRATGAAISMGLDSAGRVLTGQKQDLVGTTLAGGIGFLSSGGGSPLEEGITRPFYESGKRISTPYANTIRPHIAAADATLGRYGRQAAASAQQIAERAGKRASSNLYSNPFDLGLFYNESYGRAGGSSQSEGKPPGAPLKEMTRAERAEQRAKEKSNDDAYGKRVVYASTNEVSDSGKNNLTANKVWWASRNYNATDGNRIINSYYKKQWYESLLINKQNPSEIIYIPVPSTTGNNILPKLLAERLQADFGGTILNDAIKSKSGKESKKSRTLVDKIENGRQYIPTSNYSAADLVGKKVVIVDDVVTTGDTTMAVKAALDLPPDTPVVSLGVTDAHPPFARNIQKFGDSLYHILTDTRYLKIDDLPDRQEFGNRLQQFFSTESQSLLKYANRDIDTSSGNITRQQQVENAQKIWRWLDNEIKRRRQLQ